MFTWVTSLWLSQHNHMWYRCDEPHLWTNKMCRHCPKLPVRYEHCIKYIQYIIPNCPYFCLLHSRNCASAIIISVPWGEKKCWLPVWSLLRATEDQGVLRDRAEGNHIHFRWLVELNFLQHAVHSRTPKVGQTPFPWLAFYSKCTLAHWKFCTLSSC